jgi:hypothetical protein
VIPFLYLATGARGITSVEQPRVVKFHRENSSNGQPIGLTNGKRESQLRLALSLCGESHADGTNHSVRAYLRESADSNNQGRFQR